MFNKNIILTLAIIVAFSVNAPASMAQDTPAVSNNDPVEITADDSLTWNRAKQNFVASKNAKATQGQSTIESQTLTAHYREGAKSGLEIHTVEAKMQVKISNQANTAYGDHATYDLDKGLAILTGEDLKLVSPDQTITAQDQFEYWVTDGRVIAKGRPRVTRPKIGGGVDTLDSDQIIATLENDAQGKRVVKTLEASGNVIITTPTEIVTGAYGIYRRATNKIELTGGVTIKRGPNVLEGERAEVNLTTNISELFGNNLPGGRVRGVFFPNSEKQQKAPAPKAAAPQAVAPIVQPNTDAAPKQPEFVPLTRP